MKQTLYNPKTYLFILFILFLSLGASAQTICKKKKKILIKKELKEEVGPYVAIDFIRGYVYSISTNNGEYWYFLDRKTKDKKEFQSITHLINFMWDNNWKLYLISPRGDDNSIAKTLVFERKNPTQCPQKDTKQGY